MLAAEGEGFYAVELDREGAALEAALERAGRIPLPPYIRRAPGELDRERYQTIWARAPGSAAAPTAGLHFTEPLLARLEARGVARTAVTLHVGPGTFLPVRGDSAGGAPHARRALRGVARGGGRDRRRAARAAAASSRWGPRRSGPWRAPVDGERVAPGAGRTVALHPARARLPGGGRARHELPPAALDAAHARLRVRRARSGCSPPTARPSRGGTASSATATRCCCSPPRRARVRVCYRMPSPVRGDGRCTASPSTSSRRQYLAGYRPEARHAVPADALRRRGSARTWRCASGSSARPSAPPSSARSRCVRRVGRPALPPGVELQLDAPSVAAAGFLAMAARGEPVTFKERAPRYAARAARSRVEHGGDRGRRHDRQRLRGRLRGPLARPAAARRRVVALRLGRGFFAPAARAVVCWNQPGGAGRAERRAAPRRGGRGGRAWRALVEKVAASGARRA